MQTFMPFSKYSEVAKVLDDKRLGKQRVEAYQILKVLSGESKGWRRHPAVLMWLGHERSLCDYGLAMCQEWEDRGFVDNLAEKFHHYSNVYTAIGRYVKPKPGWVGCDKVLESHQSNLLRKLPEHYRYWFDVPDDLPYIWPTKIGYASVFFTIEDNAELISKTTAEPAFEHLSKERIAYAKLL